MISEGSCETKDWSNDAWKFSRDITGINDILKYIKIENSYHKLWAIWKSCRLLHTTSTATPISWEILTPSLIIKQMHWNAFHLVISWPPASNQMECLILECIYLNPQRLFSIPHEFSVMNTYSIESTGHCKINLAGYSHLTSSHCT